MATRCCRRCALSWRNCAARRVGKSLRRPCPQQRGQRSIVRGHGRCLLSPAITEACRGIGLYATARGRAGENREALLTQGEPQRDKPLGMWDALSSNNGEEAGLLRCHCLAQGRRKFRELGEDSPAESAMGVEALKAV